MEQMTVAAALSGMSMALFCAVVAVFLVAISTLLTGGVVYAFVTTGRWLIARIRTVVDVRVSEGKPVRVKTAKEAGR